MRGARRPVLAAGESQAVAFHDHPGDSLELRFSPLAAVHCADALASVADKSPINQDIQLDKAYLSALGLEQNPSLWREIHEQQMKQEREGELL